MGGLIGKYRITFLSFSWIWKIGKWSRAGAYSADPVYALKAHPCKGQYILFPNKIPSILK